MSKCDSFVAAALLVASLSPAWAQPATASSTYGVAAIEAYKGTWKLNSDSLNTAHSKAGHDENVIRNDCWRSGDYFACNQYVDGESKALLVFTFNAAKNIYTSYVVPADGSPASSGHLEIQGDTWIYPWETSEEGHTLYFRVVNVFKSPSLIDYRREFSTDKVNWVVMARGTEVKSK